VGHLGGHVDGPRGGVERVEVLGEALPGPVDALVQRGAGDVLHALHELDEEALAAGAHRREAHAAVPHHHGGDAVPARRRQLGVPGDLAVVVGVDVDPAGCDNEAVGVELAVAALGDTADLGDAAAVHRHVGGDRRRAGAVHDGPPTDHELVHRPPTDSLEPDARYACVRFHRSWWVLTGWSSFPPIRPPNYRERRD
jgi:hypothetical protein